MHDCFSETPKQCLRTLAATKRVTALAKRTLSDGRFCTQQCSRKSTTAGIERTLQRIRSNIALFHVGRLAIFVKKQTLLCEHRVSCRRPCLYPQGGAQCIVTIDDLLRATPRFVHPTFDELVPILDLLAAAYRADELVDNVQGHGLERRARRVQDDELGAHVDVDAIGVMEEYLPQRRTVALRHGRNLASTAAHATDVAVVVARDPHALLRSRCWRTVVGRRGERLFWSAWRWSAWRLNWTRRLPERRACRRSRFSLKRSGWI